MIKETPSQLREIYNHGKNPSSKLVISLNGISKKYHIHEDRPTLAENVLKSLFSRSKREYWALKDINLKIYRGEKVGFYGPNGSGKTTLLKIIGGITNPTSGTVKAKGRVVSLIDLESGFHPDLTGFENIILNGMIIGMTKRQIKYKIKKIISFAGIGDFIYAPLYTYSKGMKLRLGLSIAVNSNPDILILDEITFVGDKQFRERTEKTLNNLFKNGKTVLIASHWLDYLESNCTRLIHVNSLRKYSC